MQRLPSYRTAAQQTATLARMAPRGEGWRPRVGSRGYRFWTAIAAEFTRVRDLILDIVLVEAIPNDSPPSDYGPVSTLAKWEEELGIIVPAGATDSQRAEAVVARLGATGGITPAYYAAVALAAIGGVGGSVYVSEDSAAFEVTFAASNATTVAQRATMEQALDAIRPLHLTFICVYV